MQIQQHDKLGGTEICGSHDSKLIAFVLEMDPQKMLELSDHFQICPQLTVLNIEDIDFFVDQAHIGKN